MKGQKLYSLIFLLISLFWLNVTWAQSYSQKRDNGARQMLNEARSTYKEDPSGAIDQITKVIIIGLETEDEKLQADSYVLLGEINDHLLQYDLAAANYLKGAELYKNQSYGSLEIQSYKQAAKAYELNGDLREAIRYYELFVKLKKETASPKKLRRTNKKEKLKGVTQNDEIAEIQLTISELYGKLRDYRSSAENIKELESNFKDIALNGTVSEAKDSGAVLNENSINYTSSSFNRRLGDVYASQFKNDSTALQYYDNSLNIAEEKDEFDEIIQSRNSIAGFYDSIDKPSQALEFRKKTLEILEDRDDSVNLAKEYLEVGKLELKLNDDADAEESLEKAVGLAESSEITTKITGLEKLTDIAEKRGDKEKALDYYRQLVLLKQRDFDEKEMALRQRLAVNSNINQKQQRINLLEKNNEINGKTIEILKQNDKNQKIWIYSLLGGLLLFGVSGYLMYKNMRQKRVANQLIALKSLRSQMNPHFIFNALNSVNLYISQKDERTANKYLTDFSRLMRLVLEQSQKDFITLQGELEMIKLYMKLEHDRFSDKFEYSLDVDQSLDEESFQIPPMLVQPYIENAIWHGLRYKEDGKGILKVHYQSIENGLEISISDDGIGRKRSKELKTKNQLQTKSTGMYNIENRVKIINDMFKTNILLRVEDLSETHGTKVVIRLTNANTTLEE